MKMTEMNTLRMIIACTVDNNGRNKLSKEFLLELKELVTLKGLKNCDATNPTVGGPAVLPSDYNYCDD